MLRHVRPGLARGCMSFCTVLAEPLEPRRLLATIGSGESIVGTLGVGGVIEYEFNAAVGTPIIGIVAETAGDFEPRLDVVRPDGTVASGTWNYTGIRRDVTADQAGTWKLRVSDQGNDGGGNYRVTLASLPGAQQSGGDAGPIVSGTTRRAFVDFGDLDVFTFQANAGASVRVSIGEPTATSFEPSLDLYAPDGTRLGGSWNYEGYTFSAENLPLSGTYYAVAGDEGADDAGTYDLSVAVLPSAGGVSETLQSGVMVDGELGRGGLDVYTFNASAGAQIILNVAEQFTQDGTPRLDLYNPSGDRLTGNWNYAGYQTFAVATTSGTYSIVVSEQGADQSLEYNLSVAWGIDANQPVDADSGPIGSGEYRLGQIGAGDLDVYTIAGQQGGTLQVSLGDAEAADAQPRLDILSPTGQRLFGNWNYDGLQALLTNLPLSGTYVIVVSDQSGDQWPIDYALTAYASAQPLAQTDEGGTIASGQVRSGAISDGDADVWTFSGVTGGSVEFNLRDVPDTAAQARMDLIDPDGIRIAGNWNYELFTLTLNSLPKTGTYHVVVTDNGADQPYAYSLGFNTAAGLDTTSPRVLDTSYRYNTQPPVVDFLLSEPLDGSLMLGDLVLTNRDTGATVSSGLALETVNSRRYRLSFPGHSNRVLPNGNWRLTVPAASIADGTSNTLQLDLNIDFYTLAGDANRDRVVSLADFLILRSNFGGTGVFSDGDFNYDGTVSLADFLILRANFGIDLPPSAAASPLAGLFPDGGRDDGDDAVVKRLL